MHIKVFTEIGKCVAFLMREASPSSLAKANMLPLKLDIPESHLTQKVLITSVNNMSSNAK